MKLRYNPTKLTLEPERTSWLKTIVQFVSAFLIGAIVIGGLTSSSRDVVYEREVLLFELFVENQKFTKERFRDYLDKTGVMFPDIVYAQAIQESGFSSNLWFENNNPFGMRLARSRPTTAIGERGGFADYSHWKQAVQDIALYQAAFLRDISTEEEYLDYLQANYAQDKTYRSRLEKILRQIR